MNDATEASGTRHDVPEDIRKKAHELKAEMDRYAGAMGRPWVAEEALTTTTGLLVWIAREALILHSLHAVFAVRCGLERFRNA